MQDLYRIIYASEAAEKMTDDTLGRIRDAGLRHNEPAEVFGVLLYRDGVFVQLLEGPREAVESTLGRIHDDPRHTNIRVIHRGPCMSQTYRHYSMGVFTDESMPPTATVDLSRLMSDTESLAPSEGTMDAALIAVLEHFGELSRLA
jgi:hypothetical protein